MEEIWLSLVRIVRTELLGGDEEWSVEHGTRIIEDLGADSLDEVELVMAIEEEFDLDLTSEQVAEMWGDGTVGSVADWLEGELA